MSNLTNTLTNEEQQSLNSRKRILSNFNQTETFNEQGKRQRALDLVDLYNGDKPFGDQHETITANELSEIEETFTGRYNDVVYSNEDYADQLYDLYTGNEIAITELEEGDIVSGEITSMSDETIQLEIGCQFPVYLELKKENNPEQILKEYTIGDTIDRLYVYDVVETNRTITTAYVSLSKVLTYDTGHAILDAVGTDQHFEAEITEIVNESGYFVDINGVQCFLPGSLAAPNKIIDFKSKIGEVLNVVPVNTFGGDKSIVVSHKAYIQKIIPKKIENLELVTKEYTGSVTGCAKFGVFVEFEEYLTGLIHKSELDDKHKQLHQDKHISPGDKISFRVKEVASNDRIILSQKELQENPWYQYNIEPPAFANVKVVGIKNYGLFLEVEPEIVGLLHVSEMNDSPDNYELGDDLTVVISKIERQKEKIYFTQQFNLN